jgi:pimeloyl-ACP methyl ester carboxylesterase
MKIKEFGKTDNEKIIILHGGGLSWWSLEPIIRILSKEFHVITPVIDGHGEDSETTFVSIGNVSEKIISYIDENCDGSVKAICGLSLGAQIVVDILSKRYDISQFAIIESALVKPIKFLKLLYLPMINMLYPLIKYRWYSKLQAKALLVPEEQLDKYYEDSCKISKESLMNITFSNGTFELDSNISNTKAKVLIFVGEKERKIMKQSAKELHEKIKGSELVIVSKSGHGEISLRRPKEYCDYLFRLFGYKMKKRT